MSQTGHFPSIRQRLPVDPTCRSADLVEPVVIAACLSPGFARALGGMDANGSPKRRAVRLDRTPLPTLGGSSPHAARPENLSLARRAEAASRCNRKYPDTAQARGARANMRLCAIIIPAPIDGQQCRFRSV
jgi:hypothetical protein